MMQPPEWMLRFLRWFCPANLLEGIEGDLLEQFHVDLERFSVARARWYFFFHVFRFFRPGIFLRNKIQSPRLMMYSNYLLVSFRSYSRRKLYLFINSFGLSTALAFSMLIVLFLYDESRYDSFHKSGDRIYRVDLRSYDAWDNLKDSDYEVSPYVQQALAPALKEEIPGVEYASRYNSGYKVVVSSSRLTETESITFVDRDFFQMFSFEWLAGNRQKVFSTPDEVVITPELARKYFGDANPVGQLLRVEISDSREYLVTGVVAPAPSHSSLSFQLLIPQTSRPYYKQAETSWTFFNSPTFVQILPGVKEADLSAALQGILKKYMSEDMESTRRDRHLPAELEIYRYELTPIQAMHLKKEASFEKTSDPIYGILLSGIAILILVIAAINYITLSLTHASSRRVEVGVRKSIGAGGGQVTRQFLFESVVLTLFAWVISLGLVVLCLPVFNYFTGKEMHPTETEWVWLAAAGGLIAVITGLAAGVYPALTLSRFQPAVVLKGSFNHRIRSGFSRPLVLIQFTLSTMLMVCSLIMYRQMNYIATKDLGFNSSQVMVVNLHVPRNMDKIRMVQQFRQSLQDLPEVSSVTGTTTSFTQGWSRFGYKINGESRSAYVYGVDPYYVPTLGLKLVAGRNFDPELLSDSTGLLVNEALVRDMGWKDPLQERLNWREDSLSEGFRILGVVKDYHFLSLESRVEPAFLTITKEAVGPPDAVLIRTTSGDLGETIRRVETVWKGLFPDRPFNYSFLDNDLAGQYESYERWMKIAGLATGFALLIAALGMFGLSGINAMNRTKEVGIRKILGAGSGIIYLLLNREFLVLMGVALLLGIPAAWWVMTEVWMTKFSYQVLLGAEVVLWTVVAGLGITLATVSYHAFRAMKTNPAETLKYE